MRQKFFQLLLCALFAFGAADSLHAQGTAFNYQGQLSSGGSPATGIYDLTFALYLTNQFGTVVAGPINSSDVAVTNGLFTTTLDFGTGIFTGANFWLQITVRTNGNGAFTTLSPRQPLVPAPYSIFANTASNLLGSIATTQLNGTLPSSQISGNYSSAVTFSNSANHFAGTFGGDGSSLSNLNASQLTNGTVADARLSANVALLNTNQTFTGSNHFTGFNTFTGTNNYSGVNTFTNLGNSFSGSFFGNGLVGWVPVNGTATNAVRDTGYLLLSSGFTTVTLPTTVSLFLGDVVRVSGAGPGGWQIKENSGQIIFGNLASYTNRYSPMPPFFGDLRGVAASADGTTVYVVGNFNGVLVSGDSGKTYSPVGGIISGNYQSVACSANGRVVYVAPNPSGTIKKSSDGGLTWAATASSGATVACTADGSTPFTGNIACSGKGTYLGKWSGSAINVSTNGGTAWFSIPAPGGTLNCLGVSSDCTRLVAGIANGLLYASANFGTNWTSITTTNQSWSSAWMSPDGSRFAGAVNTVGSFTGGIYYYGVSPQVNTVSTNSTVSGSLGSAVELQYIGNGQFMPVSTVGTIWAD
jgi:hypothetical protein